MALEEYPKKTKSYFGQFEFKIAGLPILYCLCVLRMN